MSALTKKLLAAAVAGVALHSAPALAAFSFSGLPFVVNPSALGEPNGPFNAGAIDFSYSANVNQQAGSGSPSTSPFQESGLVIFGTFRQTNGGQVVFNTGLNSNYQLYATFSGAGTSTANAGGGIDGSFNTFNITFFVDTQLDTTFTTAANGQVSINPGPGSANDVSVLTGTLNTSRFTVNNALNGGDFDVLFNVTGFGTAGMGFFSTLAGGSALTLGDIAGNNSVVTGAAPPPAAFSNATILGSGNTVFGNVPEPASLALVGLALAGLGLSRRKSRG